MTSKQLQWNSMFQISNKIKTITTNQFQYWYTFFLLILFPSFEKAYHIFLEWAIIALIQTLGPVKVRVFVSFRCTWDQNCSKMFGNLQDLHRLMTFFSATNHCKFFLWNQTKITTIYLSLKILTSTGSHQYLCSGAFTGIQLVPSNRINEVALEHEYIELIDVHSCNGDKE